MVVEVGFPRSREDPLDLKGLVRLGRRRRDGPVLNKRHPAGRRNGPDGNKEGGVVVVVPGDHLIGGDAGGGGCGVDGCGPSGWLLRGLVAAAAVDELRPEGLRSRTASS